jgi:uncharacterized DUF497 family protein
MPLHFHFEWDDKKAATNLRKHKVSFAEAVAVFSDPLAQTIFDPDHGAATDEERWVSVGQVDGRKLVVVVHTWLEADTNHIHVRLISARLATSHEIQDYEG